jgi:hypothetical protein
MQFRKHTVLAINITEQNEGYGGSFIKFHKKSWFLFVVQVFFTKNDHDKPKKIL